MIRNWGKIMVYLTENIFVFPKFYFSLLLSDNKRTNEPFRSFYDMVTDIWTDWYTFLA